MLVCVVDIDSQIESNGWKFESLASAYGEAQGAVQDGAKVNLFDTPGSIVSSSATSSSAASSSATSSSAATSTQKASTSSSRYGPS